MRGFTLKAFGQSCLKGFLAGICISMGCIIYLYLENKIAGSMLFSVGLITILILGLSLYTGKVGYLISGQVTIWETVTAFISNFAGCYATFLILTPARIMGRLTSAAAPIVQAKLDDSFASLFVLGIFCGMLMFTAAETFKRGYWFVPTLCVMMFILAGFEHSIADMFYFLLIKFDPVRILVIGAGNAIGGWIAGLSVCRGIPFKHYDN